MLTFLTDWPLVYPSRIDAALGQSVRLAMQIASLGRAARSKAKVRVRQPLAKMEVRVRSAEEIGPLSSAREQVLDELNVKAVSAPITAAPEAELGWFQYQVRPKLDLLGPKYGREVGAIARALAGLDPAQVAKAVGSGDRLQVAGHELLPEEIQVIASDQTGWASASEGGYTVRVFAELTPELEREGLARELVHRIQNMRRSAGFDISDRIVTTYQGTEAVRAVMRHRRLGAYIRGETLSRRLVEGPPPEGAYAEAQRVDGMEVVLGVRRV
jgi:isoleucyl-tRNA synthetase